jgi:nucleotide-binding universal stress UspA family protein
MLTLLLPVDGSPGSDRAVSLAIKLHRSVAPVAIHLLHVLPHDDGIALQSMHADRGSSDDSSGGNGGLSSARRLLDEAGISYVSDVRSGFIASTIIQYASMAGCHGIMMGTRGMGSTGALLGSIARQVIQLTDVPVTLVK